MLKKFDTKGTFRAYKEACKWLTENVYSYSPSCAMRPTAILKGDYIIAKWKNLTSREIAELDGKMVGDMREGPVIIHITKNK